MNNKTCERCKNKLPTNNIHVRWVELTDYNSDRLINKSLCDKCWQKIKRTINNLLLVDEENEHV